jgi:DNA invertase Pin-like site-specific DNA recombinase
MSVIGVLIRNSTAKQVGNYRSEAQYDLGPRIEQRGHTIRYYDEQGTSGSDLTKRKVAMQMLDDMKAGVIQGIAAFDFKRLTRDEFGVDGGTIARRIVEAHGQFHTWDREYNLRLDDDLMQFQFQCFIAGLDWRNIRNTLWSGTFKKLEREPHYMKTPLGYVNVADDRDKKHVAKNPEHQHVIDALARLFDECDSLAEICRRLNTEGPARPAFRGRGGESTRWMVYGLRYILRNTIYTGTFRFGVHTRQRSTVWDKFALDASGAPRDFEQFRPDLAYWDPARVRRWRRKFDKPANTRTMKSGNKQALPGVLECETCGSRMIGFGAGTYACSAKGVGRGTDGRPCTAPQKIREFVALRLLREELPNVLADAQGLAERARANLLEHAAPSAAKQRLAFLEERVAYISQQMLERAELQQATALLDRITQAQLEIATLKEQVVDEEDARLNDEEVAAVCDLLLSNPIALIDGMSPERQGRVYTMLFANVRIETRGFGGGRQWRLRSYTARLVDEPRVTPEAPWARCPHPRTTYPDGERPVLIFGERAPGRGASDISARGYVDYLPSLVELAGALSLG